MYAHLTVMQLSESNDGSTEESAEEYVEDNIVGNSMVEDIDPPPDDVAITSQNYSEKSFDLAR